MFACVLPIIEKFDNNGTLCVINLGHVSLVRSQSTMLKVGMLHDTISIICSTCVVGWIAYRNIALMCVDSVLTDGGGLLVAFM